MVLLAILLLAVVTVPLAGGWLARLADIDLRALWAIVVALGLQVLIISVFPDRFEGIHVPLHIVSYAFAGVFVWANRSIPGMLIIGVGALSNFVAIAANGGVMPASPVALRAAGLPVSSEGFSNSASLEDPKVSYLGDIWSIPDSWPIVDNVFSIGDVLIALGLVLLVHGVCGSRWVPRALRGDSGAAV